MSTSYFFEQINPNSTFTPTQNSFINYRKNNKYHDDLNRFGKIRLMRNRRSKYDVSRILEKSNRNNTDANVLNFEKETNLSLRPSKDRTIFTDDQMHILESAYRLDNHPNNKKKEIIANLCGLELERVKVWYQNRRAKEKRMKEDELATISHKTELPTSALNVCLTEIQKCLASVYESTNTMEDQIVKNLLKESNLTEQEIKIENEDISTEMEELNLVKDLLGQAPSNNEETDTLPRIESFFSQRDALQIFSRDSAVFEQYKIDSEIRAPAFPQSFQFSYRTYIDDNLQVPNRLCHEIFENNISEDFKEKNCIGSQQYFHQVLYPCQNICDIKNQKQ
ncbi:uncharacterized protein LOC124813917 [Hydra vulgaris]|uniref:uncharacterized protein LOC124813917 n=1 Tax=Hydra vulgaris TaxID=6087 RepID=UPI001F5F8798|nr:uncharacterized protein LOC124813917 [Hydra vulgaris]